MRVLLLSAVILLGATGASQAAQQLGDVRMHPVIGGKCPAGMAYDRRANACIAQAPNGCCAPNPPRAVCANGSPVRWQGHPNDLKSGAAICPR